jgi:hypothetical protein
MSIGKIITDLAPGPSNNRNSEGSFARLSDGRIVLVYSRFRGGMEDGDACDIAAIYSSDNGETFSEPEIIFTPESKGAMNLMSVSLVELDGGEIAVIYGQKRRGLICIPYITRTSDFKTFTPDVRCIDEDGYYVLLNDRVRKIGNKLMFCVSKIPYEKLIPNVDHDNLKNEKGELNVKFLRATAEFYESDDLGRSWRKSGECSMPHKIFNGLHEPCLEALSDGRLYAIFRNDSGRFYESYSSDGYNWTAPEPSVFTGPVAPMCTRKLKDGRIVFIYNPVPLYYGNGEIHSGIWTGGRNPYVIRIASGDLSEIGDIVELERDETRGFSYCAVYELDGELLLGYCAGGVEDKMMLNRLRIRKIKLSELY